MLSAVVEEKHSEDRLRAQQRSAHAERDSHLPQLSMDPQYCFLKDGPSWHRCKPPSAIQQQRMEGRPPVT